jgi:HEAT repeat protein
VLISSSLEVVGPTNISSTLTFRELTLAAVVLQWPEIPCLNLALGIRWVEKGGPPVYRIVVPLVVLLLLAGCKGGSTTSGKPATTGNTSTTETTHKHTGTELTSTGKDTGPKLTVKYEGQTADVWAKQLLSETDKALSENAAFALKEIGEESLPFLPNAMEAKQQWVKINALSVVETDKSWAKNGAKYLVPMLDKALHDDAAKVRKQASAVIAILQFPESVAALKKAVAREEDPNTKAAMEKDLQKIK